jgi:hypothetical protein
MRRLGSAIVVFAALLTLGVGTGSASAIEYVHLDANGELLAAGAPFLATSTNLEMSFNSKQHTTLACTRTAIGGAIALNGKTKATATLPEAETSFSGGDPENEARCRGGFVTTGVFLKGLNVTTTGKVEFKEALFELEPESPHKADEGRCKLKLAAIKGTFPVSLEEPGVPFTITVSGARLRVLANSGKECGTAATLNMTLETSSAGSPILADVLTKP